MIGQPLSGLEKVTEVPSGSLYPVAMGDGSGTKAVTQETLTKEVGKGLKVGNLAELQTENKNNLVAAINEAAQSGGGGAAVDILDTKEEIEANTESGKAAGAQAVKEMFSEINDNLKGFTPVIDENTGKMTGYKTAVGGADTVFPFSGNYTVVFRLTLSVHGYIDGKNYGSSSWNITAKISDGKCTFSPSSVPMTSSILSSDLGAQKRVYVPWSITLISITAD